MITLIRWLLLQQKKIKWELAFWQFVDKQANEMIKSPEEIEKKIIPYLAELVHNSNYRDKKGNE